MGWSEDRIAATRFTDDAAAMIAAPDVEVVVEATGHAPAGIAHARRAIAEGKHIVMVNVEADVLAGAALAREAERAGVVYSLAYGDQPALICETGGLGARLRVPRDRRWQGHEVSARVPCVHAGDGLGVLRTDRGAGAGRQDEPADVQLVPGWHEIGNRDGGGGECHRPYAAAGWPRHSRPAARTSLARDAALTATVRWR